MADFVAVLRKTLDGLGDPSPAMRSRVYDKARATVASKLAAMNPLPPAAVTERQKRALEEAIATIERDYAAKAAQQPDPLAELEDVFTSLQAPQPRLEEEPAPKETRAAAQATTPEPPNYSDPAPPELAAYPDEEAEFEPDEPDTDRTMTDGERGYVPPRARPPKRRSYGKYLAAAVVLAMLAGGGFGIWLNKDAFGELLGLAGTDVVTLSPVAEPEPKTPLEIETEPPLPETAAAPPVESTPDPLPPAEPAPAAPPAAASSKFTQRLTPEGAEVDPGPAGGQTTVGEGTSIAALTEVSKNEPERAAAAAAAAVNEASGETEAAGTSPVAAAPEVSAEPSVAVAQKAIFYEERTSTTEGSAEPGTIVWSLIQESPGANMPPEPAIRAEASIPGKDVQLRMTIKRNADQSLPASHIIEMIFLVPDGFEGGGVENILRVAMKSSEQEAGSPLIGIPAKIADGFFLVALNDTRAEIEANLTLLRRQSWIDVPVVYKSGRRALLTMEKGVPGDKVFDEALKAWQTATAG